MGIMSWLFGKEEEEAPAEPLVLGALLKCDYGSQLTFLNLKTDDIDINSLPQACVEDSEKETNIQPFGTCLGDVDCILKMSLDKKWVNTEPQSARVNGKEIITTKSTLRCSATGMTIRPVTSGQDGKFARFLIFIRNMDFKYPGLREVLEDPYGNLYLEGKYEIALQFLEDQMKHQDGGLEFITLYDPGNLEGKYMLAALERLMVDCDVSSFDGLMDDLTQTAIERDMLRMEGWNKNYLNEAMMELLLTDCRKTAERIATDPVYRAMVEHKMFSNWLRESTNALVYTSVIYASMLAMNNTSTRRSDDKVAKETQKMTDQEGGSEAGDTKTVKYGEQFGKSGKRKVLKPNVEYTDSNGYKYTTDEVGRISEAEGNLKLQQGTRNSYAQRIVGRDDRLPTDDGGHLIGTQFNGSGQIDNLVPQSSNINRSGGEWYKMEQTWSDALKSGSKVEVDIKVAYKNSSTRPDGFTVNYKIDGKLTVREILNQ